MGLKRNSDVCIFRSSYKWKICYDMTPVIASSLEEQICTLREAFAHVFLFGYRILGDWFIHPALQQVCYIFLYVDGVIITAQFPLSWRRILPDEWCFLYCSRLMTMTSSLACTTLCNMKGCKTWYSFFLDLCNAHHLCWMLFISIKLVF